MEVLISKANITNQQRTKKKIFQKKGKAKVRMQRVQGLPAIQKEM